MMVLRLHTGVHRPKNILIDKSKSNYNYVIEQNVNPKQKQKKNTHRKRCLAKLAFDQIYPTTGQLKNL